jgi:hypothetical protein
MSLIIVNTASPRGKYRFASPVIVLKLQPVGGEFGDAFREAEMDRGDVASRLSLHAAKSSDPTMGTSATMLRRMTASL